MKKSQRIAKSIMVFLAIMFISTGSSLAETYSLVRDFLPCYSREFAKCTNCGPTEQKQITLNGFLGMDCPMRVSYLYKICYCPQPQVFIDLNYVRLCGDSATADMCEGCCKLFCYLYSNTDTPPTQNCPPAGNFWDCFNNNQPNQNNFASLMKWITEQILDFEIHRLNETTSYKCSEGKYLRMTYYWPSSCFGTCIYSVVEHLNMPYPPGQHSVILLNSPCNMDYCCGRTCEVCINDDGTIEILELSPPLGPQPCYNNPEPQCKYKIKDQIITIGGDIFDIIDVKKMTCWTPCNPNYIPK